MKDNPYRSPEVDDKTGKTVSPPRRTRVGDMAIVGLVVGIVTGSATGGIVTAFLRSCAIVWHLISESQSPSGISVAQIAIGDVVAYVCLGALLGGVTGALVGPFVGFLTSRKGEVFRRPLLGISMATSAAAALAWCLLLRLVAFGGSFDWTQSPSAVAVLAVVVAAALGGSRLASRIADAAWRSANVDSLPNSGSVG